MKFTRFLVFPLVFLLTPIAHAQFVASGVIGQNSPVFHSPVTDYSNASDQLTDFSLMTPSSKWFSYDSLQFSFSLSGTATLLLDLSCAQNDSKLYVYDSNGFDPLNPFLNGVVANDDVVTGLVPHSQVQFAATAGAHYTAVMTSWYPGSDGYGTYALRITPPADATVTTYSAAVTPVPEPSTYGLLGGAGLAGLVWWRRRRSRSS